jgi:hypothetical protein
MTWVAANREFRITGTAHDALSAPVTWDYVYGNGQLDLSATVATSATLTSPAMNLPFPIQAAGAALALDSGGATFSTSGGTVAVTWIGGATATVSNLLATGITATPTPSVRCLRIPLLRNGSVWFQHVRFTVGATTATAQIPKGYAGACSMAGTASASAAASTADTAATGTTAGTTTGGSANSTTDSGTSATTDTPAQTTTSASTAASAPPAADDTLTVPVAPAANGANGSHGCGLGAGVALMLTVLGLRRRTRRA